MVLVIQLVQQSKDKLVYAEEGGEGDIGEVQELRRAIEWGETTTKISSMYYKNRGEGVKKKQEVEPPPAYVLEGKIIKIMKRNKQMGFE